MVVAHEGGGGFGVVAPVQQERQLLGGGVQLGCGLGAKFNGVFRHIAAFDSFHGGFNSLLKIVNNFPSKIFCNNIDDFVMSN